MGRLPAIRFIPNSLLCSTATTLGNLRGVPGFGSVLKGYGTRVTFHGLGVEEHNWVDTELTTQDASKTRCFYA